MVCKFFLYEDNKVMDAQMAWRTKCRRSSIAMGYWTNGHRTDRITRCQAWVGTMLLYVTIRRNPNNSDILDLFCFG